MSMPTRTSPDFGYSLDKRSPGVDPHLCDVIDRPLMTERRSLKLLGLAIAMAIGVVLGLLLGAL